MRKVSSMSSRVRHKRSLVAAPFVAALAVAACAAPDGESAAASSLVVERGESPTGPGAAEPNLATTADGRVILSWLEPAGDSTTALRLAMATDSSGWSEPREVTRRDDLFVNWADFPSVIALADGRLLAHWLQRNGSGTYAYDVRVAESGDNGRTWSESVTPHTPGIEAEHGFVAMMPTPDSGAAIVLLDGGAGGEDGHGPVMHLRYATWGARGDVASQAIIDHSVCDCCQTGIAMTTGGPVVTYRDRTDAEVRDIYAMRLVDGEWQEPRAVHADGWKIDFCPVNGPAISAIGDTVVVAWFAAPDDSAKARVAFSTDGGATFAAPVRIDGGKPTGRVDVELLDGRTALVSWVERVGVDEAEVWARLVGIDGTAEEHAVISTSSAARSSGFPRMTRTTDGVVMAWTIPGTPSEVRTARVRVGTP